MSRTRLSRRRFLLAVGLGVVGAATLAFGFVVAARADDGILTLIGSWGPGSICSAAFAAGIATITAAALVAVNPLLIAPRALGWRILRGLVVTASTLAVLVGVAGIVWFEDDDYTVFESPDGRVIVVKEWSFLLGGSFTIYAPDADGLLRYRASIPTDDGFKPIQNNAFELTWLPDGVSVHYSDGNGWFTKPVDLRG